jgi:rhamnose transport system permease protein
VLRKARARGIKVVTWDADAAPDARDYFINQATPEGIGFALVDEGARLLGGKGEFAIVTGPLASANQNAWMEFMHQRVAARYPGMKLVAMRPSDDDRDRAFAETQTILKVYPQVKLIITISAPAVPGSAEAVQQSGRHDVFVIGLSLPSLCKRYVHDGVMQAVVLWKTRDLGYLTVLTAALLVEGRMGKDSLQAGRLGTVEVRGSQVILGKPFIFNKANIDEYDF